MTENQKERPILFSGPMVRALLSGQKTQTRRVVKPKPKWAEKFPICQPENMVADHEIWWWDGEHEHVGVAQSCPYGQVGDRLWVRETWGINDWKYGGKHPIPKSRPDDLYADALVFAATEDDAEIRNEMPMRPSIHMPRWASRLTLQITDIRVHRLLACSDADARAEGLKWVTPGMWSVDRSLPIIGDDARQVYFELWDHINGTGAAAANPWVWAITFEVVQ